MPKRMDATGTGNAGFGFAAGVDSGDA